jgi:hypothetical protein
MNDDTPPAACTAPPSDLEDKAARKQPPNAPGALKKLSDWFTFENRCMVCGAKFGATEHRENLRPHLDRHCEEGVMKKWGKFYEQVKAHPVGFPGI